MKNTFKTMTGVSILAVSLSLPLFAQAADASVDASANASTDATSSTTKAVKHAKHKAVKKSKAAAEKAQASAEEATGGVTATSSGVVAAGSGPAAAAIPPPTSTSDTLKGSITTTAPAPSADPATQVAPSAGGSVNGGLQTPAGSVDAGANISQGAAADPATQAPPQQP